MRLVLIAIVFLLLVAPLGAETIQFFGSEFETRSVVFCVDTSNAAAESEEFFSIKVQLSQAIASLNDASFNIVGFGASQSVPIQVFSPTMLDPTAANRQDAIAWLDTLTPGSNRCLYEGIQTNLDVLGASFQDPRIIVAATGPDECAPTLPVVLSNPNCTPILFAQALWGGADLVALRQEITLASLQCSREFRRGDSNADGRVDILDAIDIVDALFGSTDRPNPCPDARDTNHSGWVDVADAIALLAYLFSNGPAPADPGPATCGPDGAPTELLTCHEYGACP